VRKEMKSGLLVASLLVSAGAAYVGVSLVRAPSDAVPQPMIAGIPGPTLEDPLGSGEQTSLAAASTALGTSVPLPATASVSRSDVGKVWMVTGTPGTMVAVTFPAQGLIIVYRRPVPDGDALTQYKGLAQSLSSSQVISSGGTPALLIPQNSDDTGANFGVVLFEVNGTEIGVMGHEDNAALEAIATSVLDQSGG